MAKIDFTVWLKDWVQPVSADSYEVNGGALVFLIGGNEIAAFFGHVDC